MDEREPVSQVAPQWHLHVTLARGERLWEMTIVGSTGRVTTGLTNVPGRDESLGQTYAIVRRESDGQIVRLWIAPNSPLVYAVPWADVNSRYTVPTAILGLVPLDSQYPQANQLARRFDGGDDRIFSYDASIAQWRHVPDDLGTFQSLGFYWCDVTAADASFFARASIGPAHPSSGMAPSADYPSCRT